jgi:type VI secretion system protein ImpA
MEPHSPIPYMIHRAVSLGQLPFPKLMSQWVKEESTLEMFCRELGLSPIDATESGDGK